MNAQTFELIVITPEKSYPNEPLWVNKLFAEGLSTLHLRKPQWSADQLIQYLKQVDKQYHQAIMVHHHQKVMNEFSLKGVHFRPEELPIQKPDFCTSCSVHSWQEFRGISEKVDYALISPFFDSISKTGYAANKELHQIPVGVEKSKAISLGGIKVDNLKEIQKLNFRGAAVLGAIWNTKNPVEAYVELKSRIT